MKKLTCLRCTHSWYPRATEKPVTCPNPKCRSPYWDKAKGASKMGRPPVPEK